jgi:uncharacterized protein YgfB (UPF0149 family)
MLSIKFSDAASVLAGTSTTVTAAEAHGCLCGALCASNDYTFARWFEELADDAEVPAAESNSAKELMQTVYTETMRALRGGDMEFSPLLPEDDAPLAKRAEALAQWCQGFLYGFGSAAGQQRKLPAEVDEVVRDLTQIARASAGESEPTEEDEEDYFEIIEYVRVGVQSVHDALRPTLQ